MLGVHLDLEVEAAFFGTTIPAGNVTLTLVVCGAQSTWKLLYEAAQNYNAVASWTTDRAFTLGVQTRAMISTLFCH